MPPSDRQRYMRNLQGEIDGAALYQTLADLEDDPSLAAVYRRMAETEARHAQVWRDKLRESGVSDLPTAPGWRTNTLIMLAQRFGPGLVLPTIVSQEKADSERYSGQADARAAGMAADERSHARLFREIGEQPHGMSGGAVARLEGRHRASGGLAAAVDSPVGKLPPAPVNSDETRGGRLPLTASMGE